MALDTRYREEIFVEVFEKSERPDGRPESISYVTRRENVTLWTDAQRAEYAQHLAGRIDRDTFGVRIARVTVEAMEVF